MDDTIKLMKLASIGITEASMKEMLVEEDTAIVIDMADGMIIFSTKRVDEMFGYIQGELQGMNFTQLIPERFRERHKGHVEGFRKKSERRSMGDSTGLRLWGLRKDDSEFEIEIELIPRARYGHTFTFARITPKRKEK